MRICYVLAYRAPDYIRTRSLCSALAALPNIDCHLAINTQTGLGRYRETLAKVARIRALHSVDLYILGFRGHELYWPLRHLVGSAPIIFDAMMSPSFALAEENQYGWAGRLAARLLWPLEKSMLRDAELILTDTSAHVQALAQRYAIPADKIEPLPVGAVETAPKARHPGSQPRLRVLFYGSFLPLHGLGVILKAAETLQDLPLDFEFIGGNSQTDARIRQALDQAGLLRYRTRRWVNFADILSQEIPNADLCLGGPFGNTPQARRIITGKTSQALAQALPTIVGEAEEIKGFIHQKNCLLIPQGDFQALSTTLRWAYENRAQLSTIGEQGQQLYRAHLSLEVVAQCLSNILLKFKAGT